VTFTGFPHWQTLAVPNVAVQLPAESTVARTLTGPLPQSTLTFTDPVAHPVAVPRTRRPVGTVAFGGSVPTAELMVMVQGIRTPGRERELGRSSGAGGPIATNLFVIVRVGQSGPHGRVAESASLPPDPSRGRRSKRHDPARR
jgi:hypothetical protein